MQQATEAFDIRAYVGELGDQARTASRELVRAGTGRKNAALKASARLIRESDSFIRSENQKDLELAKAKGLASALLDRLELTPARIEAMADGLDEIAELPDPVGEISDMNYRPSGIQVGRMRVPLGVIGIVYESRPNVTADAAGLCIKSGNAVILRGGSESLNSNRAVAACIRRGIVEGDLPEAAVQMIDTADRAAVGALLKLNGQVDLIVPRGGKGLIERVMSESTIPMLKHLDGVCHVYVDDQANMEKAVDIAVNAKTQRFGTCNTMETLLVHKDIASNLLPQTAMKFREAGVELRGCGFTCEILPDCVEATEEDWYAEYLGPVLAIRVVADMDQAIEHVDRYGSQHTDAIVTENIQRARRFLTEVDSSSVIVNASTRFADGFEYGLGAEIGISTDKLHARGPVGLEGLTTQKFIVMGDGHIRT